MKRLLWILIVASLAVNATLAAALVKRRSSAMTSRAIADSAAPASTRGPATATGQESDRARRAGVNPDAQPAGIPPRTLWERLASRDPATFVENLRQAGFPLGSRRGAVYALLRDLQTPERVKAVESLPVEPYWKAAAGPSFSTEYYKEITRLWHERDRIMRSLFPEEQLAFTLRMQARYGSLPAEKLEKLAVLDRDYSEMRMQLSQSQSGLRMPWSSEQFAFLDAEMRKDLAAILNPRELEEYDLRASTTAMSLQRQLAGFNPTETEFRELYRIRAPLDSRMRTQGFTTPEEYGEAQRQLADRIKGVLGDARFADYQRATDAGVQSANRIAERLGLPSGTGDAVYHLQREIQQREAAIRGDTAQSETQREARLGALAEEAKQKLSTLLTPRGLEQYRSETYGRSLPVLERTRNPVR